MPTLAEAIKASAGVVNRGGLPLHHGQQVSIVEAAEHQDHDLEAHCSHIRDHHDGSLGSPSEST
jgi:hypothetical protein